MATPESPTTSPTLLGLLTQCENEAAWQRFVALYTPLIDNWCRGAGLQSADTDEIRSRVLEGLVTALKDFCYDPAGKFRGYLHAAVNNAIRTFRRQRATRPGIVGTGGNDLGPLEEIADPRDTALAALLDDSMTADLRDAYRVVERVRGLVEPETWRAYWLVGIEGKPASEVATTLGKTVAAVYMAKSRVGKLLQSEGRRLLGEELPG
jgi:RNA polymerase sigma-70 factor (ECF subfamily)